MHSSRDILSSGDDSVSSKKCAFSHYYLMRTHLSSDFKADILKKINILINDEIIFDTHKHTSTEVKTNEHI